MLRTIVSILIVSLAGALPTIAAEPWVKNVVFILADDHRYDFMGFHPNAPKWLETPNLDRMAKGGAHFRNAFVSTSLCSPSRASVLTGQYMHHHRVVDNQRPVPKGTTFFPQILQKAGIQTALVGKWHMGHDNDAPRPGFDHWASYKGQGTYFDPTFNINGHRHQFKGYNADVTTNLALDWLRNKRDESKPFFLYVSYKAVHYPFLPATRHKGRYAKKPIDYPETMARTARNYRTQPRWVSDRRYSIHGIDHMETGAFDKDPVPNFDNLYHSYAEAVHSLDENIGHLLTHLNDSKLADDTLVLYMGDNGFHLGEHGFYDKRDAFETSIRVPLLAYAPGKIRPAETSVKIDSMVQNIDIAPTILEAFGVAEPAKARFDGRSFLAQLQGRKGNERDHILYEYHWEWNFPATPTLFAIRTDRYKYVYYHGVWDRDSFHDLKTDPHERHNLIDVPSYREQIESMRTQLFAQLKESGALTVPYRTPAGDRLDQRKIPLR